MFWTCDIPTEAAECEYVKAVNAPHRKKLDA